MSARHARKPFDLKKTNSLKTSTVKFVRSPIGDSPRDNNKDEINAAPTQKQIWTLRALFFAFFFCFWKIRYGDFLFIAQEYDLFVWNYDYLREASLRVAGLSRFVSSFIIQFFYYPTAGALILSCFASITQYAAEKVFQLKNWRGIVLSFIPPCLSTLSIVNINYYIFERVDVAYLFSFTFNFCFALIFALIFESFPSPKKRVLFLVTAFLLLYPILGFFALLAAFLCVLKEWSGSFERTDAIQESNSVVNQSKNSKTPDQRRRERCELLSLFVLLVPGAFWFVYSKTTPNFHYMYTAGLWEESTLTQSREAVESNLITPFLTLLQGKLISRDLATNSLTSFYTTLETFFLLALSCFNVFSSRNGQDDSEQKPNVDRRRNRKFALIALIVLASLCCACATFLSFSSKNYQALLRIARYLDQENWEAILVEEAKVDEPINPLISARNLALFKTNRIGEELFQRPTQPKYSPSLQVIETANMCGDRILYEYGATNMSSRIATNNLVIKRERSAWALKTLSLCAIVDKRPALAKRFLYRLQGTLFHKKFASETLDLLNQEFNDRSFDEYLTYSNTPPLNRLEELNRHFESIRRVKPQKDVCFIQGPIDQLLYNAIQSDDFSTKSTQDRENCLSLLLLSRDYSHLGSLMDQYLLDKGIERAPRYLQEAILWRERFPSYFDDQQTKDWSAPKGIVIDQQIRENFNNFTKDLTYLTTHGSGKASNTRQSADELIDVELKGKYGDTFWYHFGASVKSPNY